MAILIKNPRVSPSTDPAHTVSGLDFFVKLLNKPQRTWFRTDADRIAYEKSLVLKKPEACSTFSDKIVDGIPNHGLASAANLAYSAHYPLILTPDIIWITLVQGLATHINQNAETLRSKFVSHEGQKTLVVERNSFKKGSPDNDWQGVFSEFSSNIMEHIVR